MKKFFVLFLGAILFLPTIASAHTQLSGSNPQQGQVISEDIKEIALTFEGNIEKLSTMGLLQGDKEIPLNQIQIQGAKMVGTLKTPLDNGTYRLQWKIAGQDGHPVTGEIQFQVQKNLSGQDPNTPTTNQEQGSTSEQNQNQGTNSEVKENPSTTTAQQTNVEKAEIINKEDPEKSSNNIIVIIFIGLLVILVIGFFLLFRRK
ncbi:copper resistance CopC family protein [Neobacillus drentensis]|uniref:copper resistance CopC family protein n=1 Tax=Neobacillus drentensis TaxID=220684 RepID=UPI00300386D3